MGSQVPTAQLNHVYCQRRQLALQGQLLTHTPYIHSISNLQTYKDV